MAYKENPNLILARELDHLSSSFNLSLCDIVREIAGVPANVDFTISKLSGGMTNILYKVLPESRELWKDGYVVRLFALSKAGLAPPFVGLFQNGRVEGYLPARPLELEEFKCPKILPHIARATCKLHGSTVAIDTSVGIWEKLHEFFTLGIECVDRGKIDCDRLPVDLRDFERESLCVLEECSADESQSFNRGQKFGFDQVLSHNDLLSGNVLYRCGVTTEDSTKLEKSDFVRSDGTSDLQLKDDIDLTLIDYEYVCYNYRAFDIANHFCEFAGFEFDIENMFPPKEPTRTLFLRQYLQAAVLDGFVNAADAEDAEFINGFDSVVMHLTLLSHLFWGSWAIVQAGHSSIDFDYMGYASKRFGGYFYHKNIVHSA